MAEAVVNVIPLSSTTTKLYFRDWDGPTVQGLTTITYDSTEYDVLDDGREGCRWTVVDAAYSDFGQSRVTVEADFPEPSPSEPALGYGLLYNWYAATDVRGVAPSGFRIPETSDRSDLYAAATRDENTSERDVDGGFDEPRWVSNFGGTNTSGFNALPSGEGFPNGNYQFLGQFFRAWDSTMNAGYMQIGGSTQTSSTSSASTGFSIRCVSDNEPSTDLVQDADGNNYTWIQIGTKYWLQQNLKTTTYNNGDSILFGLDNTPNGAWAYPNGDSSLPI
jgi:uncharacterized protein (TIGR02145 family)